MASRTTCAASAASPNTTATAAKRTKKLPNNKSSRWSSSKPLTPRQLEDLQQLRRRDLDGYLDALAVLHPNRAAQLQAELMPAEVSDAVLAQVARRESRHAETVVAHLNDVVAAKTRVDPDRLGFWLDMLSPAQIDAAWRAADGPARKAIAAAASDEIREAVELDASLPQEPTSPDALAATLRARSPPASELLATWKARYASIPSVEPRDYAALHGGMRRGRVQPNARFTSQEVRRIKATGPTLDDVILQEWDLPSVAASLTAPKKGGEDGGKKDERRTRDQDIEQYNVGKSYQDERYQFMHPSIVWETQAHVKQPKWRAMRRMPYMEFYHGIRQRNWTSSFYDPNAEPWHVEVFMDGGPRFGTSFGVRAVVTAADGTKRWIDMPRPGADIALEDRLSNGGPSGAVNPQRLPAEKSLNDYGYLQIFEQLQEAHEPFLSPAERADVLKHEGVLTPSCCSPPASEGSQGQERKEGKEGKEGMEGPDGVRNLTVSYLVTPAHVDKLHGLMQWKWLMIFGGVFGIFLYNFFRNLTLKAKAKERRQGAFEDMNEAIDFGRSRADTRMEGKTGVSLSQVAGIDYLRDELEEVIDLLKNPAKFGRLRVRPPKGILLMGPPGVGKTLIAKAVAGEAGVPFYSLAGSEFTELIVGVGAARVRDLFKRARVNVPCLIFIDEIEALGHQREMNDSDSKNEERDQALNQLLTEMDGFTPDTGIVVMAATNAAHLIDSALLRPGRFDRKVTVRKPNAEGRRAILAVHAQKHPVGAGVDLNQLALDTPGLSGAELEKVLNESALETMRRGGREITPDAVYVALDRILEGSSLPPLPEGYECNRVFAYHEAGVALIASLLRAQAEDAATSGEREGGGGGEGGAPMARVKRVSLLPRNRSWSRTTFYQQPGTTYKILSRDDLMRQVRVQLAGRAAETIALGEPTTYSALDVSRAGDVAVKMLNGGLTQAGVLSHTFPSDYFTHGTGFFDPQVQVDRQELLDLTYLLSTNDPQGLVGPTDEAAVTAFEACRDVIAEAMDANLDMLRTHRGTLDRIAEALAERKELSGDELEAMLASEGLLGGGGAAAAGAGTAAVGGGE